MKGSDLSKQLKSTLEKKAKVNEPFYIKVKILPKSAQTEIVDQFEDGTYKIRVAALPLKGEANEVLCKFLKKLLTASQVKIISGAKDSIKLIRIDL